MKKMEAAGVVVKKIPFNEFKAFEKTFDNGGFPHQRFGQAFENHFGVCVGGDENENCIWNVERSEAMKKIYEHYIG